MRKVGAWLRGLGELGPGWWLKWGPGWGSIISISICSAVILNFWYWLTLNTTYVPKIAHLKSETLKIFKIWGQPLKSCSYLLRLCIYKPGYKYFWLWAFILHFWVLRALRNIENSSDEFLDLTNIWVSFYNILLVVTEAEIRWGK